MSKLKKLDEWVCNNNIISAELCRIQDNIEREFIALETELAELRERCWAYEAVIGEVLSTLNIRGCSHNPEVANLTKVLAKYKGGYNERR